MHWSAVGMVCKVLGTEPPAAGLALTAAGAETGEVPPSIPLVGPVVAAALPAAVASAAAFCADAERVDECFCRPPQAASPSAETISSKSLMNGNLANMTARL